MGSPKNESTSNVLHRADTRVRVLRKKQAKPKDSRIEIPRGAAIYATVTATTVNGIATVHVHGDSGLMSSFVARKGPTEVILPSATIVGLSPGNWHIAWDGREYVPKPTMKSIQETNHLTLIGSVSLPPSSEEVPDLAPSEVTRNALLADKISGAPFLRKQQREEEVEYERNLVANQPGIDRPPLPQLSIESIERLLHAIDQAHWPNITAMRVKTFYPPDVPVPPQSPKHLLSQIRWYASRLFGEEADQYDQFRSDVRYGSWLSSLADRTRARVMKALDQLETDHSLVAKIGLISNKGTILGYHGLTTQGVEKELRTTLSEIRAQYEQGTAPSQRRAKTVLASRQVGDYAAAGVDIASGSPLLKMAMKMAQRAQGEEINAKAATQLHPRRAFVEPLLDEKGWSILDWANEAEVAYHTAADYLAGSTKTYRSSRLKLAKALSVSIQQLPR